MAGGHTEYSGFMREAKPKSKADTGVSGKSSGFESARPLSDGATLGKFCVNWE